MKYFEHNGESFLLLKKDELPIGLVIVDPGVDIAVQSLEPAGKKKVGSRVGQYRSSDIESIIAEAKI